MNKTKYTKIVTFVWIIIIAIAVVTVGSFQPISAQAPPSDQAIMILVDNSGSIGNISDTERKVSVAKKWLAHISNHGVSHYLNNLGREENANMGLIEFGGDCQITPRVTLGNSNHNLIKAELKKITPEPNLKASTPIYKAIIEAARQMKDSGEANIVLFTDGGENCEELISPCAAMKRVINNILKPNAITLDIALVGYTIQQNSIAAMKNTNIENCIEELNQDASYEGYIRIKHFLADNPESLSDQATLSMNWLTDDKPESSILNYLFIAMLLITGLILGLRKFLNRKKRLPNTNKSDTLRQ